MANYITQEGYNKKMEELAALEAQRPMIKQAIAEARDKGCLLYTSPSPRDRT